MSPRPTYPVPQKNTWALVAFLLAALLVMVLSRSGCFDPAPPIVFPGGPGEYLFCFWNTENLFDDQLDSRPNRADVGYDKWFAEDARARQLKYEHLSQALLKMNDGRGPDILAVAELESKRSAELLQQALNQGLNGRAPPYGEPAYEEVSAGRHIATAVITRLHLDHNRTQLLRKSLRILEVHVDDQGRDLVIIASHWTSRVSDEEGTGRDKYADLIYGRYKAMFLSNPKVDFLVCGDFNDPPDDDSVTQHLHGVGDVSAVRASRSPDPLLLDLLANKDPEKFGTHYYRKQKEWFLFDQILISPGLLDSEGWSCDLESIHTENALTADSHGHPREFGNQHDKIDLEDRGYSDHFPVTVRLRVH
jgi:endonuclease/exonuclease/phosphatase family metal-dependent hydrolase